MKKLQDLKLYDWQYEVRHNKTTAFSSGEIVFLKSSIECPMIVCSIGLKEVSTMWENKFGDMNCESFSPECILQYRYAGLLVWCSEYRIC